MTDTKEQHRAELLHRLLDSPAVHDAVSIISWRDAQDRAELLSTPDAAIKLLRRARLSGDRLLARAVARHAAARIPLSNAWRAVLDEWATSEQTDPTPPAA